MSLDLSYYEALMGVAAAGEQPTTATGGVWVVALAGRLDDGLLRLIGKGRVLADALGAYVHLLMAGEAEAADGNRAIQAGADRVWLARGTPALADLVEFFRPRGPQVVLFPFREISRFATRLGRTLGPGLAQALNGSLCARAADLEVDPIYQRVVAHQPVLDDAARQRVALLASPAVAVVDTTLLPAAFNEPWRTGTIEDTGLTWPAPPPSQPLPQFGGGVRGEGRGGGAAPLTLANAAVIVAGGLGLKSAEGFALAARLAQALGAAVGGDMAALDAGWISEDQLIGLAGARSFAKFRERAPRLFLALGMDGDTGLFMSIQDAGLVVAVQPDPSAPIAAVADYNIYADPVEFARVLLGKLQR